MFPSGENATETISFGIPAQRAQFVPGRYVPEFDRAVNAARGQNLPSGENATVTLNRSVR